MKKTLSLLALAAVMGWTVGCGSKDAAPVDGGKEPEKVVANTEAPRPTDTAKAPEAPKDTPKPVGKPDGKGVATDVKPEEAKAGKAEPPKEAPKGTDAPQERGERGKPPEIMEAPTETPQKMDVDPKSGKPLKAEGPKPLVNFKPVPASGNAAPFKGKWDFEPSAGLKKMQDQAKAKGIKPPDFNITIDGKGGFTMLDATRLISGTTVATKDGITLHPAKIDGKTPRIQPEITPRVFKLVKGKLSFQLNGKDMGMNFKKVN